MAATYEPIATQTLGSAAASVTFSSISGIYTDLILVVNGSAAGVTDLGIQFNSDTGSNYSITYMRGNGTTASSGRASNATVMRVGNIYTAFDTTAIIHIMNYSNTTTNKTVLTRIGQASGYVVASVGLWRSTAAISTVLVNGDGTNLSSGSTFTLYGIKAA
jgi:hypothetical protein